MLMPTRIALLPAAPVLLCALIPGGTPATDDVVNLALADVVTYAGEVGPGHHGSTHVGDSVAEVLTEMQTSGKPSKRLSLLDHVWLFDIAAGNNYVFEVEAHRTPNAEGDDFHFTYSLDEQVWLPLLTVSNQADDIQLQSVAFPVDVAGPMYVRVEDTDRTPGHRQQDALSVDFMAVVSDRTQADTTPPPAGSGLSAVAGDQVVSLAWTSSPSADVTGYRVERAVGGGAFEALNAAPVVDTVLEDDTVSNMTLYRYRVRTIDAAGNAGAASPEVQAVPHTGGDPGTMHVTSIQVGTQTVVSGWKAGRARVAIRAEDGDPVAGALVVVTFGGMYHETLSATTDADGIAIVITNQAEKGKVAISGCVVGVTHPTKVYVSDENGQTCDG
jgi:hypothetical protein